MTSENDSSRRRKASWPALEAAASLSQACAVPPSFLDLLLVMDTLLWTPSFLLCTAPPPHHCFLEILFPFHKTLGVSLLALKTD